MGGERRRVMGEGGGGGFMNKGMGIMGKKGRRSKGLRGWGGSK